jgi:hypothetical protein
MKEFFILTMASTIFFINCFGQESDANKTVNENMVQKALIGNWQHYATNNIYTIGIIRQKYELEAQIAVLQKQRLKFIAEDRHKTYTSTPYPIIDEHGYNRIYSSREAYDNEIIGGLIKSSLRINDEIIRQEKLYFAAHRSHIISLIATNSTPPNNLTVTNN